MYDAFRYISMYYTVTNGSAAFDTVQAPLPHITVYYICIHKLITFFDIITLNYTSMTHCVVIHQGIVAFYRDLTRITVSNIKYEWI